MRPLFRRYGNLTGYDRLLVLCTVTFWCLYGLRHQPVAVKRPRT